MYRDLFVHKLGFSPAEWFMVLLADGMLLAVLGVIMRGYFGNETETSMGHVFLQFAFSVPHERYSRLHKLTLMSVTSSWFWETLALHNASLTLSGLPQYVDTTMLTDKPENKTARGVMKLVERIQLPDRSYKLSYSAPLVERSAQETVKEWLTRYGQLTKD